MRRTLEKVLPCGSEWRDKNHGDRIKITDLGSEPAFEFKVLNLLKHSTWGNNFLSLNNFYP
jgi:hypothetical protein